MKNQLIKMTYVISSFGLLTLIGCGSDAESKTKRDTSVTASQPSAANSAVAKALAPSSMNAAAAAGATEGANSASETIKQLNNDMVEQRLATERQDKRADELARDRMASEAKQGEETRRMNFLMAALNAAVPLQIAKMQLEANNTNAGCSPTKGPFQDVMDTVLGASDKLKGSNNETPAAAPATPATTTVATNSPPPPSPGDPTVATPK